MPDEEGWSHRGRVSLQSTGCKLNQAEIETLARQFESAGYRVVSPEEPADIFLLNTCTVTHVADRKCRNLLRRSRARNPRSLIVAIGCYADRAKHELTQATEVDLVLGNKDKGEVLPAIQRRIDPGAHASATRRDSTGSRRTRSLVKIQEGCSRHCSFCIVPHVRGAEHSRTEDDVLADVHLRIEEGSCEVVLTGTRIGKYSGKGGLAGLIERILSETTLPRLRLSSLEPRDVTPDLLRLWEDSRLCPHIHMPLQSGSDNVLKQMGRDYTTRRYLEAAEMARQAIPDLALTTDIMVGFPAEGRQEFEECMTFCREIGFARMHVFPFSPRHGTSAAAMPDQVPPEEKERRKRMMLGLASASSRRFREAFLGRRMAVLWEAKKGGSWQGLTGNYIRVYADSREPLADCVNNVDLIAARREGLAGRIASPRGLCRGARGL